MGNVVDKAMHGGRNEVFFSWVSSGKPIKKLMHFDRDNIASVNFIQALLPSHCIPEQIIKYLCFIDQC